MALVTYHRHMTQRVTTDPYWRVNCNAYSGAMLVVDSTLGGMTGITGKLIRSLSSEPVPDPDSPGLNIPQVLNVCRKLHVPMTNMEGHSWAEVNKALNERRRVTLAIDYGELPEVDKCQGHADFGHQIVLIERFTSPGGTEVIRGSDPLCTGPRVYVAERLQKAAIKLARDTGIATGVRFAMTRPIPRIEG